MRSIEIPFQAQMLTPAKPAEGAAKPRQPKSGWSQSLLMLRDSPYTVPLVAIIAVLLLVISELSYRNAMASLDKLEEMRSVRIRNLELLRLMVDAETGQRGYMLTGRDEYLTPYRDSIKELRQLLEPLSAYYADDSR